MLSREDVSTWGTLFGIFLVAVVQQFSLRRNRTNALRISDQLAITDASKNQKLDAIHTLVNSGMGKQLQLAMTLSRRIAEMTHDPEDLRVAERATADYNDYLNRESKSVQTNS